MGWMYRIGYPISPRLMIVSRYLAPTSNVGFGAASSERACRIPMSRAPRVSTKVAMVSRTSAGDKPFLIAASSADQSRGSLEPWRRHQSRTFDDSRTRAGTRDARYDLPAQAGPTRTAAPAPQFFQARASARVMRFGFSTVKGYTVKACVLQRDAAGERPGWVPGRESVVRYSDIVRGASPRKRREGRLERRLVRLPDVGGTHDDRDDAPSFSARQN